MVIAKGEGAMVGRGASGGGGDATPPPVEVEAARFVEEGEEGGTDSLRREAVRGRTTEVTV